MRKLWKVLGFIVAIIAALMGFTYYKSPLRQPVLMIFGDSISDAGNGLWPLFQRVGIDYPTRPYLNGRFCNGPMWPEYIPGLLGWRVHNYAISCARVSGIYKFCIDPNEEHCVNVPSMKEQVKEWLGHQEEGYQIPDYYVTVIQSGGNDISDSKMEGLDEDEFERRMFSNFTEAGELLIERGARHVLFMNLPLPEDVLNPITRQCTSTIKRVQSANKRAAEELQNKHQLTQVQLLDAEAIARTIVEEYRRDGKKLSEPCITAVSVINGLLEFYFNFRMGYDGCDHPEQHWMWDEIHPSADVHKKLAAGMVPYLRRNYFSPSVQTNQTFANVKGLFDKMKNKITNREEL